jgi:hypothetical protein
MPELPLENLRVAVLVADDFEESELTEAQGGIGAGGCDRTHLLN